MTANSIQQHTPLAPLTTLKVGGPARFFTRVENEDAVAEAFDFARENRLDVFVLGGGSNILVSDAGFDGLVIQISLKGIEREINTAGPVASGAPGDSEGGSARKTLQKDLVTARAGEDWDAFVDYCVGENLAGVECLSGIPGSVGGTPVQNVGAYGQEVSESIVNVRCYDRESGEVTELSNAECGFTYRTSIFNTIHRDRYVVLAVTYQLTRDGQPKIAYKDLREYFGDHSPTLKEVREAVLEIRRAKSMVIDADDPNSQSAGSFFKNPIVDTRKFDEVRGAADGDVPHFPAGERIKIPAAWLIEQSGFYKGYSMGNAGISTKHSLALVNRGGASAADIFALKEKIQNGVLKKFDILLQPEPVFIGFE